MRWRPETKCEHWSTYDATFSYLTSPAPRHYTYTSNRTTGILIVNFWKSMRRIILSDSLLDEWKAIWTKKKIIIIKRPYEKKELCAYVTSMFAQRMEVLKYRSKLEVELRTFPDLTLKRREKWFLNWHVCLCVCVCEEVCQWISYEHIHRFEWKFRCMLQLASNRETPVASGIGPIFPHNLGRGGFRNSLNSSISKTASMLNLNTYKFDPKDFFDISNGFWDISKKNCLWKVVRG